MTSLVHDPDIRGLVLNTRDISERRRLEEQLTLQAYSDGLTGLANRSLFRSKVETALKVALDRAEVGVLFLDLDGFKAVNDAQGHHVGDELLGHRGQAARATAVRPGDLVARLGGDEFAILVTGPDAEEGAIWAARAGPAGPVRAVRPGRPGARRSAPPPASRSATPATRPPTSCCATPTWRCTARRAGGTSRFVRFEAQMHDALLARMKAESDLRQAVDPRRPGHVLPAGRRAEQPHAWSGSRRWCAGSTTSAASSRRPTSSTWPRRPGWSGEIGRWALEEGCKQGARWQQYAAPGGHFKMAVNVSARQLDATLPRQVRDILSSDRAAGSGADPGDDRERADGPHRRGRGAAPADEDPRPQGGGRRLRHRLLVAVLPVPVPGRHPQDRQVLRRSTSATTSGRASWCTRSSGSASRCGLDTVAEGIETAAQRDVADRDGLHLRPGLPVRPAAAGRRTSTPAGGAGRTRIRRR